MKDWITVSDQRIDIDTMDILYYVSRDSPYAFERTVPYLYYLFGGQEQNEKQ